MAHPRRSCFGGDHAARDFVYAVDIEDQVIRRGRSPYRSPVHEEIERARQLIDQRANVLVIDAHIGTVAIPLARCCKELWAIEGILGLSICSN